MDVMNIVYLVLLGLAVALAITSTIVSFVTKRKNGEKVEWSTIFTDLFPTLISNINKAESTYGLINGIKTGAMKKSDVMIALKSEADKQGIPFDNDAWSNVIDSIITTCNIVTHKETEQTQSVEKQVIKTDNVKF